MSRNLSLVKLLAGMVLLLLAGFQANGQELVSHPNQSQPLAARWAWGLEQTRTNNQEAWLVYRIGVRVDERLGLQTDSRRFSYYEWNRSYRSDRWDWYDSSAGWHNGHSLEAIQNGIRGHQQSFSQPRQLLVAAQVQDGMILRWRTTTADTNSQWGVQPVYWLGDASNAASFQLLAGLLREGSHDQDNHFLINLLGLHDDAQRRSFLLDLFNNPSWQEDKPVILQTLAIQPDAAVQSQLLRTARDAQESLTTRRVAVSALSLFDSPEVIETLFALLDISEPSELRREALESLVHFDATNVVERLNAIAWGDGDSRVRERAVQSLGELQTVAANELLMELARNHPVERTRREAMGVLEDNLF